MQAFSRAIPCVFLLCGVVGHGPAFAGDTPLKCQVIQAGFVNYDGVPEHILLTNTGTTPIFASAIYQVTLNYPHYHETFAAKVPGGLRPLEPRWVTSSYPLKLATGCTAVWAYPTLHRPPSH